MWKEELYNRGRRKRCVRKELRGKKENQECVEEPRDIEELGEEPCQSEEN